MRTTTDIKVRGYHLDLFSHVNNARYIELLEEARWDYIEKNSIQLDEMFARGIAFNVVNITINYRRPGKLGDVLAIDTFVSRVGNKSMTMTQIITLKGTETRVADAEVTFVFAYMNEGKAIPIGDDIKRHWNWDDDLAGLPA
ncbi:MAG TPA: thioesterase family protein [Spirochaetota bacterium]|nr:thioesterase family protein [Spirochaetota bacterium]HOS40450.1 thioesterase family protein [Spirochaetota bacterium]HPU89542.1 thioesterase family protein [Spirochaetota bacterium]